MVSGVVSAQAEVSKRKFNDAKTIIRQNVYNSLKTMNYNLNNFKNRNDAKTKTGTITFNWPPLMFSGVFNVEADYKIFDQLLASVKA
uniref:Uncharacterized protein n=1 Tax=Chenopodium quinoa TaxID=63459 RepID=A0A803M5U0_CHEQI